MENKHIDKMQDFLFSLFSFVNLDLNKCFPLWADIILCGMIFSLSQYALIISEFFDFLKTSILRIFLLIS